jgi:hypothetical protein
VRPPRARTPSRPPPAASWPPPHAPRQTLEVSLPSRRRSPALPIAAGGRVLLLAVAALIV